MARDSEKKNKSVLVRKIGFPVPLNYITPNLKFYPPALLDTVFLKRNINSHFNDNNLRISLDKIYNVIFVHYLMKRLKREYTIVGNYLIDLSRQDYDIHINTETNEMSVRNYKHNIKYQYFDEDEFLNVEFPTVDKKFKTINPKNVDAFFDYHSNRICEGTRVALRRFSKLE